MNVATLSALAEPNRMYIVELLITGPLTVGEISDKLQLRQPQASKHLRVLHDVGIVEVNAIANRRIYRLRPEPFQEMDVWLDSFRRIWEQRFDRLDEYLQTLKAQQSDQDNKGSS
jgi:DNA-binding transcriptional ArsR family regulator